jgi:SAM-dependent methyltransferase
MLPFEDELFDVVLCLGVLEYVPDLDRAFDEVVRVLRPNGMFVFSMLHKWSPYRLAECVFHTNPQPCTVFSTRFAHQLLDRHSLVREKCAFYDFNVLIAPVDQRRPRLARKLQRRLSFLERTPLRWMGTAFVIEARPDTASA